MEVTSSVSWIAFTRFIAWTGCCLTLGALGFAQVSDAVDSPAKAASLKAFLQNYVKDHRFDDDRGTRYAAAFVDLTGDQKQEAIVYLAGRWWCGSGGCPILVLKRDGPSWKIVAKVMITRPPIRVLTNSSNGWHSLGVWVAGGGIEPGYEAELQFDGNAYPSNPSVPPAQRLKGRVDGVVVIPSFESAVPLYP
jgi:hypothetical protein